MLISPLKTEARQNDARKQIANWSPRRFRCVHVCQEVIVPLKEQFETNRQSWIYEHGISFKAAFWTNINNIFITLQRRLQGPSPAFETNMTPLRTIQCWLLSSLICGRLQSWNLEMQILPIWFLQAGPHYLGPPRDCTVIQQGLILGYYKLLADS